MEAGGGEIKMCTVCNQLVLALPKQCVGLFTQQKQRRQAIIAWILGKIKHNVGNSKQAPGANL
jgi:hypothetical protein